MRVELLRPSLLVWVWPDGDPGLGLGIRTMMFARRDRKRGVALSSPRPAYWTPLWDLLPRRAP